jgi:hypothetical protein
MRGRLPAASQLAIGADDRAAERAGAVRGDQIPTGGAGFGELLERGVECRVGDPLGVGPVEHLERGVDPGLERVGAEHARAEAVDRRDECALGGAGLLVGTARLQRRADPVAELGGGLVGERDREDRGDVDPVL